MSVLNLCLHVVCPDEVLSSFQATSITKEMKSAVIVFLLVLPSHVCFSLMSRWLSKRQPSRPSEPR